MTARIDFDGLDGIARASSGPATVDPHASAEGLVALPVGPPPTPRSLVDAPTEMMPPPVALSSAEAGLEGAPLPREGAQASGPPRPPSAPRTSAPAEAEQWQVLPVAEVFKRLELAAEPWPASPPPVPPLPSLSHPPPGSPASPLPFTPPEEGRASGRLNLIVGAMALGLVGAGALWLSRATPAPAVAGEPAIAAAAQVALPAAAEPLAVALAEVTESLEPVDVAEPLEATTTLDVAEPPAVEAAAPVPIGEPLVVLEPLAAPAPPLDVAELPETSAPDADTAQAAVVVSRRFPGTFPFNSIEPRRVRPVALERLVRDLSSCDGPIHLRGHTCGVGQSDANIEAGILRAEKVRALLEAAGLSGREFVLESGGSSEPVASNQTRSGRRKNRRVVVSCGAVGDG